MANEFTDFLGDFFTPGGSGFNIEDLLPILLGTGSAMGLFGSGQDRVGYQGGIPEYTAVRERVTPAEGRRPGGPGQRYFTDITYAQAPETPAPTLAQARQEAQDQATGLASLNQQRVQGMAGGGLAALDKPRYMSGATDGMRDRIPAQIGQDQPAQLSDGEFVVPADVVSHLGNGNSNAGAKELYNMLDRVRKARTGRESQGRQISPRQVMPR